MSGPAQLIERFIAQTREYALICIDPQGLITAWLGAASAMFGYEEDEVLGKPASLLFTRADRAQCLHVHELEVARRDSRSEDDRWHVRKDGSQIWVSGSVQAVRDSTDQLLGYVKIARDRTDLQTRLERQDKQLASSQAVARRTASFLRTLGHEMRNPLSPLQNATHILRRLTDDPQVHKVADLVGNQVVALRGLADELMDLTRLESVRPSLRLEVTDLNPLLHELCVGFQATAEASGVHLASILPQAPLRASIDPPRFQQVIQNLLTNAIKYTPAGGHVWVKATQETKDVVIRIEDTGVGISPEMLPQLFELFTRDPTAEELAPSGLGVGLAVVKALMELHGGTVQARSSGAGTGAEFSVRFPAAPRS